MNRWIGIPDKLAEGANPDRTYLSGIERGVRNPGIKVVIKVASSCLAKPQC